MTESSPRTIRVDWTAADCVSGVAQLELCTEVASEMHCYGANTGVFQTSRHGHPSPGSADIVLNELPSLGNYQVRLLKLQDASARPCPLCQLLVGPQSSQRRLSAD